MQGTEVIARALKNSADRCYGVPGYPVTDLLDQIGAEMVINEKVAVEYAIGESLSGRRASVVLKNVGLNACADPFVEATTQGLLSGVVIVVGDDPEAVGSQNAQDSRYYGELAEVPVIEPGRWNAALAVEEAFRASEQFSRICLLRLTPELLFSDVSPGLPERKDGKGSIVSRDFTMRGRVQASRNRFRQMRRWAEQSTLNEIKGTRVITGPVEIPATWPPGQVSRISTVYPPPGGPEKFKDIYEEGRPFLREHLDVGYPEKAEPELHRTRGFYRSFCRECPFLVVINILEEKKLAVVCDAGCCVLCMNDPFTVGKVSYGMGSSIGIAARSTGIALTGDYALLHSGLPALIDVFEKKIPILCIVMKNKCMAMTGGQGVFDISPYLSWAKPLICPADDVDCFREVLRVPESPTIVVVEGRCPEGRHHETVEC
ncbi:MAG TPA: thiamine pyrophosphate-dependent enzyme [Methanoregulaceae archaeon]|nr:thiamine pyrophosphate-dependent enzyme [Methanoregulaceae archaeon]